MTNYERITGMAVEEMAAIIICPNDAGMAEIDCDSLDGLKCYACTLAWLMEEVG